MAHRATPKPRGFTMPPCTVCDRPDRERIDAALRGGTSVRGIAKAFDLGRTAIAGHAARHTTAEQTRKYRDAAKNGRKRAPKAAIVELKPIENPEDVVSDLQRLRVSAFDLFAQAQARADWKSAERIFSQLIAVVDRFGEMHRVLGSKGVNVTVDRSTRVLNVLGAMSEDDLRALLVRAEAGEPIALETIEMEAP
jgi:hypothetical protein